MLQHLPEIEVLRICARGIWTAGAGTEQIRSAADLVGIDTETKVKHITPLAWQRHNAAETYPVEIGGKTP